MWQHLPWDAISFLAGVAFAAGALWARDARTRKDVDGLAAKQRRADARARRRFIHTVRVLELIAEGPFKGAVMELLERDVQPDLPTADEALNDQDEREHYSDR